MSEQIANQPDQIGRLLQDIYDEAYLPESAVKVKSEEGLEVIEGQQQNGHKITLGRPTLDFEDGLRESSNYPIAMFQVFVGYGLEKTAEAPTEYEREYMIGVHDDKELVAQIVNEEESLIYIVGPGETADLGAIIKGSEFSP